MKTKTDRGNIGFECDCCDETLDTETTDWQLAQAVLKREGWKAVTVAKEWVHGCPKHVGSLK
jgi:hypothetical protein